VSEHADGPVTIDARFYDAVLFGELLARGITGFDSSAALVRQLRTADIHTAVYSSSRNCADVLRAAGVDELFPIRVDGVLAEQLGPAGKPDPAMLTEAARRLGVRPDRCVIVDDALSGVTAGCAGGFGLVVGVARDGRPQELLAAGADLVVSDMAEITVPVSRRRVSTLPDALASFGLLGGVTVARCPAVFLDFDGALPHVVGEQSAIAPTPGAIRVLEALSALCPVVVLSSYDLADVQASIGVPELWYSGSDGFEFCAPDHSHHQHEAVAATIPRLASAAAMLENRLEAVPEIRLEHRRFAIVIHYGTASAERISDINVAAHAAARQHHLRITHGHDVVELHPDLDWRECETLHRVMEMAGDGAPLLPIYIGSKRSDEVAFSAIEHDGVSIILRNTEDGDRHTAAQFGIENAECVVEFLEQLSGQLATARRSEPDCWSIAFDDYQPRYERLREVLCGIGNGYLGTRACAPEARAGDFHYPGTYVAGVYNRLTDDVAGTVIDNESIVNLPNWLPLTFRIDGGPWFDIDSVEVLTYRQSIDIRHAESMREVRFRDVAGRTTGVHQRRFASMNDPHICALQTMVTAEDWSGTIEFRSAIDSAVSNTGVERYRDLSIYHLAASTAQDLSDGCVLVETETVQSRIPVAVASRTTVRQGEQRVESGYRYFEADGCAGHTVTVELGRGHSVTIEKVALMFTGRDHAVCQPGDAARRRIENTERYDELWSAHRVAWDQLWESFNLHLVANAAELRVLRLHILHLLQTVSLHTADLDAGVPARGLCGEAYRGHIFWDDLFIIPVLNLRVPAVSRALLKYRYRRLPEARRAAAANGYSGAMFPWQSGSDGREESQQMHLNPLSGRWNPDPSRHAHHIGIAVAYNIWQYYQVTGDLKYLVDYGAEMLLEIARFWVSRADFDVERDRYVIRGVIGPDEFHTGYPGRPYEGIDNNAYTNVMAVWTIARALESLDMLPLRDRLDLLDRLDLRGPELTQWDKFTRRMFVPFHDGVISQFEGYEQLRELDWTAYRKRYNDIRRLDRILEAEHDSSDHYQVSKQADVLMLFYLLSADELRQLLTRLGYRLPPEAIPKTIDHYLNRTSHGSTLSAVVHSWVLTRGNRDQAMSYFTQVLKSDVADAPGGATSEGIHLAAMAGSLDLLQRCFSGLETRCDRLVLGPMWPETSGTLGFSIWYRGHRLHLRIRGRTADVTADPSDAAPIDVECRGRIQQLAAGSTIHIC
jgi:alpha,alpha-trehalase